MASIFAQKDFDAAEYLRSRATYPPALYDEILRYHDERSGGLPRHLAVDLGCGPGQVSFPLARHFEQVLAVDPSEAMTQQGQAFAKSLGKKGANVVFKTGTSESLPFVQDSSVDMIVSGTAAHWFPAHWWTEAERICKTGATVALFVTQGTWIHPSHPHAKELQDLLTSKKEAVFKTSRAHGNDILETLYDAIPLPERGFSECKRIKWNVGGQVQADEPFFLSSKLTVEQIVARLYTYGPSTTFAKNHPELVGSPDHPFEQFRREATAIIGADPVDFGHTVSLLLFTCTRQ